MCDDSCVRVEHSSYAARPATVGTRVLVRVFEHHIEIREGTARPSVLSSKSVGRKRASDDPRTFAPRCRRDCFEMDGGPQRIASAPGACCRQAIFVRDPDRDVIELY